MLEAVQRVEDRGRRVIISGYQASTFDDGPGERSKSRTRQSVTLMGVD